MDHSQSLRHAYRHLLRAVTYIPDVLARSVLRKHVVHRFRHGVDKSRSKEIAGKDPHQVTKKHLTDVRSTLRLLEGAAEGRSEPLQKVLLMTYGRIGKRRRELVAELLLPGEYDLPDTSEALEALIQDPAANRQLRFSKESKLYVLMQSQIQNHPPAKSRPVLKTLDPPSRKKNIWARVTPKRTQANMVKRFWSSALDKILPPLPKLEWYQLKCLVSGKTPIESLIDRRPGREEERALEVPRFLTSLTPQPIKWECAEEDIEAEEKESIEDELSSEDQSDAPDANNPGFAMYMEKRAEKIAGDRARKRIYAHIWSQTPTMTRHYLTREWTVTWGAGATARLRGELTAPSPQHVPTQALEGLDLLDIRPKNTKRMKKDRRIEHKHDNTI